MARMRTTLSLDDDVFELVSQQARRRGLSLGKAVSDLVRKGLKSQPQLRKKSELVVFDLPDDSPKVTTGDVRRLEVEGA